MRLYVVTDEKGTFPMLWEEPGPPRASAFLSWRFVAEVDSVEEADAVIEALKLRPRPCSTGAGPSRALGSEGEDRGFTSARLRG
jgi:hypothetical protein